MANRKSWLTVSLILPMVLFFCQCTMKTGAHRDTTHAVEVSVTQQKMALYEEGKLVRYYPVSTSKFGEGDKKGSYKTPLGKFEVADKIGEGFPLGAVFKSRKFTGEILKPNSPGRDPIVSRILWLNGLEKKNRNAYSRCIYIHGTAAERDIGRKASYGCVRMRSKDIMHLYDRIGWGTPVQIVERPLWSGSRNPDLPLGEDEEIPSVALVPNLMFEELPGREDLWIVLGEEEPSEVGAYEILRRQGFDVTYLDIEPIGL